MAVDNVRTSNGLFCCEGTYSYDEADHLADEVNNPEEDALDHLADVKDPGEAVHV